MAIGGEDWVVVDVGGTVDEAVGEEAIFGSYGFDTREKEEDE